MDIKEEYALLTEKAHVHLVPMHPFSQFCFFKQLMIHIGAGQGPGFELSSCSSHLINMKYFIENASAALSLLMNCVAAVTQPGRRLR